MKGSQNAKKRKACVGHKQPLMLSVIQIEFPYENLWLKKCHVSYFPTAECMKQYSINE